MIKVRFYGYEEFGPETQERLGQIFDRFTEEYPDATAKTGYDSDEEEYSIELEIEGDSLEDADTFLCEEICHEHEAYCQISAEGSEETKSYYYDEEDEWHYRS